MTQVFDDLKIRIEIQNDEMYLYVLAVISCSMVDSFLGVLLGLGVIYTRRLIPVQFLSPDFKHSIALLSPNAFEMQKYEVSM